MRKIIYFLVATAVVVVLVLELAVRQLGWFSANDPERFDPGSGLPAERLNQKLAELQASKPDVSFIGDSFVETGELEGGWVQLLRKDFKVFALGFSGASPSQYAFLLDRARQLQPTTLIVVMIYVGNDLIEQALSAVDDKRLYMTIRHEHFSDPSGPVFWPCFDLSENESWIHRRIAAYRNFVRILLNRVYARVNHLDRWEEMGRLLGSRCAKPPFAEEVKGRLFFFRDHEGLVGSEVQEKALDGLVENFRPAVADERVAFVVLFDREENCQMFHGRPVASARPVMSAMKSLGLDVLNPNDVFTAACSERSLYLPDRHWNKTGHTLFAQWMRSELVRRGQRSADAARTEQAPDVRLAP